MSVDKAVDEAIPAATGSLEEEVSVEWRDVEDAEKETVSTRCKSAV